MVADLKIDGADRRVVMQAPKNGFFYVLDAKTGKLISAKPIIDVTWATGVDLATGRPIENPEARFEVTGKPATVAPMPAAHTAGIPGRTVRRPAWSTFRRWTPA